MKRTTDRNSRRDRWRMGIERDSESEKDEDGVDALPVSFDISRSVYPPAPTVHHFISYVESLAATPAHYRCRSVCERHAPAL